MSETTPEAEDVLPIPAWMAGIAVGVQSLLWSLTLVLVPSIATYVAFADTPEFADANWWSAVLVGLKLWVVTHGGAVTVGGGLFTLVPLGLLALIAFFARVIARRSGQGSWSCIGTAAGIHFAGVLLIVIPVGELSFSVLLRIGFVTALALGLGLIWGVTALEGWSQSKRPLRIQWQRLPLQLRRGARYGLVLLAAHGVLTTVIGLWWTTQGWQSVRGLFAGLITDPVSAGTLILLQLIFLPNVYSWALGWLAGPGFQVGSDSLVTTAEVTSGALPPMPVLGIIPSSQLSGELFILAPVLLVLLGLGLGLFISRQLTLGQWRDLLWRWAGLLTVNLVGIGVWLSLASGEAGPPPLDSFGTSPWPLAWTVTWLVLIGLLVAALAWVLPQIPAVRRIFSRHTPEPVTDNITT